VEEKLKLVSQCCVCHKIKFSDGEYYRVPGDYIPGTIASHGYCYDCVLTVFGIKMERPNEACNDKL